MAYFVIENSQYHRTLVKLLSLFIFSTVSHIFEFIRMQRAQVTSCYHEAF